MSETSMAAETADRQEHVTIIVNTEPKRVPSREVSYDEVVRLAFPTPGPDTMYTVMYENAVKPHHEGSLVAGQTVTVKEEGTIFDVTPTNKS